jgi:hypothetical protein
VELNGSAVRFAQHGYVEAGLALRQAEISKTDLKFSARRE